MEESGRLWLDAGISGTYQQCSAVISDENSFGIGPYAIGKGRHLHTYVNFVLVLCCHDVSC